MVWVLAGVDISVCTPDFSQATWVAQESETAFQTWETKVAENNILICYFQFRDVCFRWWAADHSPKQRAGAKNPFKTCPQLWEKEQEPKFCSSFCQTGIEALIPAVLGTQIWIVPWQWQQTSVSLCGIVGQALILQGYFKYWQKIQKTENFCSIQNPALSFSSCPLGKLKKKKKTSLVSGAKTTIKNQ